MDVSDQVAAARAEYARWNTTIGPDDPYVGKVTIGIKEVMQAHFLLAEYFAQIGEGIGGVGPKDYISYIPPLVGSSFNSEEKQSGKIESMCALR